MHSFISFTDLDSAIMGSTHGVHSSGDDAAAHMSRDDTGGEPRETTDRHDRDAQRPEDAQESVHLEEEERRFFDYTAEDIAKRNDARGNAADADTKHLLTPSMATELASRIHAPRNRSWKLLFSSLEHGSSFTSLVQKICVDDVPSSSSSSSSSSSAPASVLHREVRDDAATLLVVRQKDTKKICGMYASCNWTMRRAGSFYGDARCAVFAMHETAHGGRIQCDFFPATGMRVFFFFFYFLLLRTHASCTNTRRWLHRVF